MREVSEYSKIAEGKGWRKKMREVSERDIRGILERLQEKRRIS